MNHRSLIAMGAIMLGLLLAGTSPCSGAERDWTIITLDSEGNAGRYADLQMGQDGRLHVAYLCADNGTLRIMTRGEGVWGAPQTIDASGSVTGYCALAVTPAGDLPVSYRCSSSGELWYAGAQEPREWVATQITTESDDVGHGLTVVRQGSEDLALAFRNSTDGSLQHMRREAGAWTPIETVDAGPNRGQYCDLAYRPGVGYAFSEYASDGTFLAFADPEIEARFWRYDALDHYDDVGRQLSMVVGPLGRLNYTYLGYDFDHGWHIRAGEYLPDSVRILRPVADSVAVGGTGHVFPDIFLTPGQNWFLSFRNAVDHHLYFATTESLQIIEADVTEPWPDQTGSAPVETRLIGAQPNPAAGRLRIYYTAAVAGPAELLFMDPGGRAARTGSTSTTTQPPRRGLRPGCISCG